MAVFLCQKNLTVVFLTFIRSLNDCFYFAGYKKNIGAGNAITVIPINKVKSLILLFSFLATLCSIYKYPLGNQRNYYH